jgi:hypothetical protein
VAEVASATEPSGRALFAGHPPGRRAGVADLATVELRLALHVLRPWVPAEHLATFWREAVDNHSHFKSLGVPEAAAIVIRELKMRGRLDE